jgi:fructose-specific phosphotransferase system IIC component
MFGLDVAMIMGALSTAVPILVVAGLGLLAFAMVLMLAKAIWNHKSTEQKMAEAIINTGGAGFRTLSPAR